MPRSKDPVEKKFRTIGKFAEEMDVDRRTVERWCQDGKIASVRIGAKTLIPMAEMARLLDEARQGVVA